MGYGQTPWGAQIGPVGTFGIKNVTVLDAGHLLVEFSHAAVVNEALYEPSNYVITVRFGRARTIYARSVVSESEGATTKVTLSLKNGIIERGQYRLTCSAIRSVFGTTIDGSDV